jgi:beta-galactosidase
MEQQPGPVNWADYNLDALPGLVRLWGLEGFAHGAETMSYFRWRQAPFAQEQFHAGLNLPDGSPDRAYHEVKQLSADLAALGPLGAPAPAKAALVFSYEASWFLRIQPQGRNFSYIEQAFAMYRALRRLGLDVDIVGPDAALSGYALVLVPSMPHVPERLAAELERCGGTVLAGPRTGSRTASHRIPDNLAPGPLAGLLGLRVTRVESYRAYSAVPVRYENGTFRFDRWREFVEPAAGTEVLAETEDGHPALTRRGRAHYLAGAPDEALLQRIVARLAGAAGLETLDLPAGLRTRTRGSHRFVFNYGPQPADISPHFAGTSFALGGARLEAGAVAVLRTEG